jgi:high-affinity iron transporter
MLAALVIVFREVLEAGLIVGIVLAASRGVPGRNRAVGLGILAGVLGSMVVAGFATQISSAFDGRGQELFTAGVLTLAVLMLTWHVAWMADHARELSAHLKQVGRAVTLGNQSVAALGIATAMAVLREGSEVVLFLSGIFLQHSDTTLDLLLGSAGGLLLGAAVSAGLYFGLSAIPLHRLFAVTGFLVTLVAAGLAAEAVHQLSNAGLIAPELNGELWDTSWLLPEDGMVGRVLHVIAGYRETPGTLELAAYVATIVGITFLSQKAKRASASLRQLRQAAEPRTSEGA